MRCTTLGTADVPTVSSSSRGDQLHRVAQSAELPEARAGRPSRAAAERRRCDVHVANHANWSYCRNTDNVAQAVQLEDLLDPADIYTS